ncbi:hypothetical protein, partial [Amycolatopsis thermoflava]|uniref:hypothetical protein n=1 Tax=Amycolatopsis thermoflava TaxID=84480 RepID=UPI00380E6244
MSRGIADVRFGPQERSPPRVVKPAPITVRPLPVATVPPKGSLLLRLFRTTDHKQIGIMYLVTSFAFFMVGGA